MTLLVQNVGPRFGQGNTAPAAKAVVHNTPIPGVTVLARPDQEGAVASKMHLLAKLGETPAGQLVQRILAKRVPVIDVTSVAAEANSSAGLRALNATA
jgi:hypothetical protein